MLRFRTALTACALANAPVAAAAQGAAAEGAPPGAPPPPRSDPPPQYYVEPVDGPTAQPAAPRRQAAPGGGPTGVYEPPPPGYGPGPSLVYEPPPPPKPKHRAPRESLWLGGRLGWFIPFGDLWGQCFVEPNGRERCDVTSWRDFQTSGGMFELDVGARLGRRNNLFLLWEHAALAKGNRAPDANGGQGSGASDYYALGIRHSSNPSTVGFMSEIGIGYRTARARWDDGTELQMKSFPLELRIALGADIRVSEIFSLSPAVSIGGGVFTEADLTGPNTSGIAGRSGSDDSGTHSWVTFQVGAHFDAFGSRR